MADQLFFGGPPRVRMPLCRRRRTLGAFFLLLLSAMVIGPPLANAQPISILYTCTPAEKLSCETQFRVCFTYKVSQIYMEVLCNCYANSYQCYKDCGAIPAEFEGRCLRQCPVDVCTPKLSPFAESRAGNLATISGAAGALAVGATLLLSVLRS